MSDIDPSLTYVYIKNYKKNLHRLDIVDNLYHLFLCL